MLIEGSRLMQVPGKDGWRSSWSLYFHITSYTPHSSYLTGPVTSNITRQEINQRFLLK